MEIGKRIDEIVKIGLAPLLKENGFSKSSRNFYRESESAWRVVNVQSSQSNSDMAGKFTVNLGVYLPQVAALAGQSPVTGKPKEYDCTVRKRIGALMPHGVDYWWELLPSTDPAAIAATVAAAVETYGLPWFAANTSVLQVADTLANQPSVMAAAAALAAGDRPEAARRIGRMEAERPMAASTARAWAKKALS